MSPFESRLHRWIVMLAAFVGISFLAATGGGQVENYFSPIRTNQTVSALVRTSARLCWEWQSDKLKPARSDNIDVWLTDPSGERASVTVFAEVTGQPWRLNGSAPIGHQEVRLCTLVPPYLKDASPVTVEQVIFYHGWHDFWLVQVRVPDVVFAPLSPP